MKMPLKTIMTLAALSLSTQLVATSPTKAAKARIRRKSPVARSRLAVVVTLNASLHPWQW